jgi:pyruvate/2-oxoglutarate dehydrogenase complex dihydrolipoamide dehydrogenase (E3) component
MHLDNYKANRAELLMGTGRFIAPKTIEVSLNDGGTRVLTGDREALKLGTHATILEIPGLAAAKPLTKVERSSSIDCPPTWSSSAAAMLDWNWHKPIAASAAM